MDFNVYEFGAVGDGESKDTAAIQKAIDACSLQGGGRVILSKGMFLTGTLFMKSHVELHIDVNAVLSGSHQIEDYSTDTYKQMYRREEHMDRCLIYSENACDIAFTGFGTIDGQGQAEIFRKKPGEKRSPARPMLLRYVNCSGIRLKDLKLLNPASWTNAFIKCKDIYVDGIDISSRVNENGDGLDFDCCENVFVTNCKLDCSDDCICLQNSETEGRCKNIVISNTIMCSKWAGMRIGLLSCGIIENVAVTNCIFRDISCSGLKIQSSEGSILQNMTFSNLIMENVQRPFFITLNHFRERVDLPLEVPETSRLRNIQIENIRATGRPEDEKYLRSCMIIDGLPGHYIENISLSNISYTAVGGGSKEDASRVDIPHHLNKRAECCNYQGSLPVYGLYARHVKGLRINNLEVDTMLPGERPMMHMEDCV